MKKRLLSVLLLLALALSLLPTTALADDDPTTVRTVKTSGELIAALADENVTTIRLLGTTEEVLLERNNDKNVVKRNLTFDMQGQALRGRGTLTIQKNCTLTIINGGTFSGSIENHGTLIGGGAYIANGVTCHSGSEIKSGLYPWATGISSEGGEKPKITGGQFGTQKATPAPVRGFRIEDGVFGESISEITDCVISGGTFYCDVTDQLTEGAQCFSVTYHIDNDTIKTQYLVGTGKRATAPDVRPDDEGRTITGWYLDAAYTTKYDFSEPVTENLTLYARWEGIYGYITTVNGERVSVTESNHSDVLGDGTVRYTPELRTRTESLTDEETQALFHGKSVEGYTPATLTLNGANLARIQFYGMLKLVLQGENKVSRCIEKPYESTLTLLVGGPGSLDISPGNDAPLYADAYIQYGGNVTVTAAPFFYRTWYVLSVLGGTLTVQITEQEEPAKYHTITEMLTAAFNTAYSSPKLVTENTELRIGTSETDTVSMRLTQDQKELAKRYGLLVADAAAKWEDDSTMESLRYLRLSAPLPEEPEEPEDPEIPELPIGPILVGGVLLAGDSNPFRDVRAIDWFYDDVMYAYEKGLMSGTAHDRFSPQDSFTRGMLLTILARHDGVNTNGTPWYQAGCDWAAKTGVSDGKNPGEAISREEFAQILYRYAQYRGSHALAGNDLTGFTDAASISSDALPAMQWAVAQAIIRGDSFRLNPQSGATRAEACAMLHRFFVT